MRRVFLAVIFVFLGSSLSAQLFQKVYYVTGRLLDETTKKPIAYALVFNVNKGNMSQSDTAGRFIISVTKNDTIKFSVLGYEPVYFTLADKDVKGKKYETEILMPKKYYNLPAVDIYEVRWNAFVYDVAHTKVQKDETQERLEQWVNSVLEKEDLRAAYLGSRGAGLINISGATKYEKQLAQIQRLQTLEELEAKAKQKFNRQLVATITGLQGEELDQFMQYLRFDRDFILKTSQYDLITIIKEIYQEYKKGNLDKRDEILNKNPFVPKK